ncbi:hypothetical protein C4D60_Mb06t13270 [Musa balbisiana]|uniref:Uncharacterized protein n=1 Tax=Musa balbisiana TaxID=52838 RepID=A0A4S8IMP3_MUSBA|nr:hypothetical protein C4D60_Mb06t13270 [Musa balbisiana]
MAELRDPASCSLPPSPVTRGSRRTRSGGLSRISRLWMGERPGSFTLRGGSAVLLKSDVVSKAFVHIVGSRRNTTDAAGYSPWLPAKRGILQLQLKCISSFSWGNVMVYRKGSHKDAWCSHSSGSLTSGFQTGGLSSSASASSTHILGESSPSSSLPSRSSACADTPTVLHRSLAAASSAAARMSSGSELRGRGSCSADSGKLSCASRPLSRSAATSCATAAISADSKLPSQILLFFPGSLISDTHFPHFLFLTPR